MRYFDFIKENPDINPVVDPDLMAKAEAQGFDTSRLWYHGTRSKAMFKSFKLPKKSKNGEELGQGVYVTKYPGTANVWAQGNGQVITCVLRKGKLFEMSTLNQTAIFSSHPDKDDRYADPMWREIYRGFTLLMKGYESSPGANDAHGGYDDFVKRLANHTLDLGRCLAQIGYIGVTSRNSQIRGQAVIWDANDVMIVGRTSGFEGYSSDPDDAEDQARSDAEYQQRQIEREKERERAARREQERALNRG